MCACRAARMGLKVLVFERHNLPGGAASSFVRGRFEFDSALHELPDFGEGEHRAELALNFDELGIETDTLPIPDAFRFYAKKDDGEELLDITFPHGREAVYDIIRRECPDDVECVDKFFMAAEDMLNGLNYFGSMRGNVDPEVFRTEHANFMRLLSMSIGEFFDTIGMSQKCKDIFSAYWPYQGADIYTVDASRYLLMVKGYFLDGAFIPRHRAHMLSLAIVERARQLGAEFRFCTEVTKVLTKKGAVCGVEAGGKKYYCTAIASNTFPEIVYSKLLDNRKLVPKYELQKANARHYGFRGFCVYMGLDASAEELGIKDYTMFITNSLDSVELFKGCADKDAAAYQLDALCLNIANPGCSPEGTCIFVLTISFTDDAWADVTEADYWAVKDRVADEMIDTYEKKMGINIRDHIEEIEIATPMTFAHYMNSPQGTIYGYFSDRWDGMSSRTVAAGEEPTIPGLFFVGGHSTRCSGFLPTYMGGNQTAYPILGYVMGGGK